MTSGAASAGTSEWPNTQRCQLYNEFTLLTEPASFDCRTEETKPGYWWEVECGGRDIGEEVFDLYRCNNFAINFAMNWNKCHSSLER